MGSGLEMSETKFSLLLLKYSPRLPFDTKHGYIWRLTLCDPFRGWGQGQDGSDPVYASAVKVLNTFNLIPKMTIFGGRLLMTPLGGRVKVMMTPLQMLGSC